MAKDAKIGWTTDRKDLVEAVRTMSCTATKQLIKKHASVDPRAVGLRNMSHECAANTLMVMLLDGTVDPGLVVPGAS